MGTSTDGAALNGSQSPTLPTYDGSRDQLRLGSSYVAGGVNSNFRAGMPVTPLVFAEADGPYLVDVDGNRFIDYVLGMGPMLLGHRPAEVVEAVHRQLQSSILVGGQTPLEYQAAELVHDLVPSADLVRFCSSGSEADQAAVRVARAATGRQVIVKFEGHYHGWFDNLLWSIAPKYAALEGATLQPPQPGSTGQMPPSGVEVLRWNDADALVRRIEQRDVAAVLMEPVMFNSSGILPIPGYLAAVRDACTRTGTVLIFDEVITGFRVSPGGAQAAFGITPDLTVLGKALASGFPVAALVGKTELMGLISSGEVLHGGTYNSQSIAMAATVAALSAIRTGAVHAAVDQVGRELMNGLEERLLEHGIPAAIVGFPSVFHVRFGAPDATDYLTAQAADSARYAAFATALLDRGIRILPRGTWFLSSTHGSADVERTLAAVDLVLENLAP